MRAPDYHYDDVQICVISGEAPDPREFRPRTGLFFYQEPMNPYDDRAVRIENARGVKAGYFYRGKLQDMANDFLSSGGKLVGGVVSYDGRTMIAQIDFYRDGRDVVIPASAPPVRGRRKAKEAPKKSAYGGKVSTALSILSLIMVLGSGLSGNVLFMLLWLIAGLLINPVVRKSLKIPRILAIFGFVVFVGIYGALNNPQTESAPQAAPDASAVVETAVDDVEDTEPQEAQSNYLESVTWAALDHYKCAVERDDYSGDVIAAGAYRITTSSTKLRKQDIPIVWDIYVSDDSYENVLELSDDELAATVGGLNDDGAEITVEQGQYLYIKYNPTAGSPVGMVELNLIRD